MWSIAYSPAQRATQEGGLKLFGLSDLNLQTSFFTLAPSLVKGDTSVKAPTRPPIVKETTPISPVASGILYQISGDWKTSLPRVSSLNQLALNSTVFFNNTTYIISDNTERSFTSEVKQVVEDPINLGFFEDTVVKVRIGGLDLPFSQIDGNLVVTSTSKSCIGRIGQTAEIWFTKDVDPTAYSSKPVVFFSKVNSGISLVTLFNYLGYNYNISASLESYTLVNCANNQFFIIQA